MIYVNGGLLTVSRLVGPCQLSCNMSAYLDSPFVVFATALAAQVMAALAGDFLRKRTHSFKQGERHDFNIVQAATLTLLALIIGFSFSMAVSRYDQRKTLEEAEANAIGATVARLPVPWLGSERMGRWLSFCAAGITLRSRVLRL